MIEIVYHSQFLKDVRKLPKAQRIKLASLVDLLQINPYNPLLHTKHLSTPLLGLLSFRITRDWRVLFRFVNENTIQLVGVSHRSDAYR